MVLATDNKTVNKEKTPEIEVVFILDNTGSMGGLISTVKDKIWSFSNKVYETIVNRLVKKELHTKRVFNTD